MPDAMATRDRRRPSQPAAVTIMSVRVEYRRGDRCSATSMNHKREIAGRQVAVPFLGLVPQTVPLRQEAHDAGRLAVGEQTYLCVDRPDDCAA